MPFASNPSRRLWPVQAALTSVLFGSGMCALIYLQIWLREFRLLFGTVSQLPAAVLVVFLAGIGFGGSWFGDKAEKNKLPMKFLAILGGAVALAVSATPSVLKLTRTLYLISGGEPSLGLGMVTAVQTVLSAVVIGLPCFLMGGALPSAIRFAQRREDFRRLDTARCIGFYMAGAMAGAVVGTFALLPNTGNKSTLMTAVMVQLLVALIAWVLSQRTEQQDIRSLDVQPQSRFSKQSPEAHEPSLFALTATFTLGFTFLCALLVWSRVSMPLMGDTIYGGGLLLAVAMAGLSAGALSFVSLLRRLEPRFSTFTWITALQAIAVLVPYALGDRLGYLALVINESLRGFGFLPVVTGWMLILSVMVLLPSVLAGIQFPLLVSLLSRGHEGVSRDLGRACYWTMLGAIAGTLIGGFVLIPIVSATQTWVIVAALIAGMSALSFMLGRTEHEEPGPSAYASFAALAGCIAIATLCNGPTAAWLEAPIGYGQLSSYPKTSLALEQWKRSQRRQQVKLFDGHDASLAVVSSGDQHSLSSNGRPDGSAITDAPTQVMLGLVGGILHPRDIQHCCVIGLGTGSTAGWLAAVPSVRRVDVIDVESHAADLAREFSTVNRQALENSKVHLIEGDAREVLQMPGRVYDVIAARPSTPTQLGTANLFTLEFYQSARERLAKDGLFCQWVQGGDTDPTSVKLIMSTLCAAFEKVEVWNTHGSDLVFVCSPTPTPWDAALVRKRLGEPVYGEACARLWHANSAEGFFSRCIGNAIYTRLVAIEVSEVNSDDRNQLEFAASRTFSRTSEETLLHIFSNSAPRRFDIASVTGPLDRQRLAYERCDTFAERADILDVIIRQAGEIAPALRGKKELDANANVGDYATYLAQMGSRKPQTISEKLTFAMATALTADARATEAAAALEKVLPDSQPLITAMRVSADRRPDTEALALGDAIAALRRSPWIDPQLVDWLRRRLVTVATVDASRNQRVARQLFDALRTPLVEGFLGETRSTVLTLLSNHLTAQERLLAIDSWGKHYPFTGPELATRFVTYAEIDHPGLGRARADLQRFLDYGGKVPQTLSPVVTALLSIEAGQEVAVMREYHKQQTAAVTK